MQTVTSAIKHYFRVMAEPLLVNALYLEFMDAVQLLPETLRAPALRQVTAKLPPANLILLTRFLQHLIRVAAHAEANKMKASNLGVVFGPTLIRAPEELAARALTDFALCNLLVELFIGEYDAIFGPDADGGSDGAADVVYSEPATTLAPASTLTLVDGDEMYAAPAAASPPRHSYQEPLRPDDAVVYSAPLSAPHPYNSPAPRSPGEVLQLWLSGTLEIDFQGIVVLFPSIRLESSIAVAYGSWHGTAQLVWRETGAVLETATICKVVPSVESRRMGLLSHSYTSHATGLHCRLLRVLVAVWPGLTAVALYDYAAEDPNDISFAAGQTFQQVRLTAKREGWGYVCMWDRWGKGGGVLSPLLS